MCVIKSIRSFSDMDVYIIGCSMAMNMIELHHHNTLSGEGNESLSDLPLSLILFVILFHCKINLFLFILTVFT